MQILIVPVKFSLVFLITLLFLSVHMEVFGNPATPAPPPPAGMSGSTQVTPSGATSPGATQVTPSGATSPGATPVTPQICYNAFGDQYQCGTSPNDGTTKPTTGKVTFGSQPAPITVIADPVGKSLMQIFQSILDVILVFAIPIVTFFIVWAGFLYVTARGDTSKIAQAHKALLYAVVGGLLVLGANVILMIIKTTIEAIVK